MKATLLCCSVLIVVAALCSFSYGANIAAMAIDGFEVIFLDQPGFVHDFHYHRATNKFYALGQATFRQIDHLPGDGVVGFSAVDNQTLVDYNQPYIDVRLFSSPGNSDLWAAGPAYNIGNTLGYFLPIAIRGPTQGDNMYIQNDKRNYVFSGISIDARNFSHVLLYLVGFAPAADNHIMFGLIRAHVDLTLAPTNRKIEWDPVADELYFYDNQFYPYHVTNRPHVIHDFEHNIIFVVDPNTFSVYSASVPSDSSAMKKGGTVDLSQNFAPPNHIAGSAWHYYADILYVGIAGKGHSGSSLAAIDITKMTFIKKYDFPANYSNPRAIAGQNRTIFIGFEGGPAIVKFDVIDWKIAGIQRLPEYLHQVYAAWDAGLDHIYFSTYEQHSKVFRLNKLDFCENGCPYNGYCDKEICKCNTGYALSGGNCVIPPVIVNVAEEEKAAAIAMGVLFAIAFVVGLIGWVLYYQKRNEGYARVL